MTVGSLLSHYRILERLGEGGSGVVWRARDERLDRDVALKVLADGALATADDRQRFRRTTRAVARLVHPRIGTIFDFDTVDGLDFLVMEYVAGETLERRLVTGPLEPPAALAVATQIAEALEASHALGVVHRDLKPANVVLGPRDQVKVLDFGIARWLDAPDATKRVDTESFAPVGTLPYMAPEQLLRDHAEPRTDLWSLGVVLYEMTTGRRPFDERLPSALVYTILQAEPAAPRTIRDVGAELEAVILRCLRKRPEDRWPDARALIEALAASAPQARRATAAPAARALAVLPLENLSGDPAQEFFTDGMTEALIGDLARIRGLKVISRTTAMRYKGARRPLPEIARELGVDVVLEGSALRAGDRVRISVQLVEAVSDAALWSERYERDLGDVLRLQADVARRVAEEIQLRISPEERERLAAAHTIRPEAHEHYLKGRWHWARRVPTSMRAAITHFERAVEREPEYALAYAGLADAWNILGNLNQDPPESCFGRARAAATRALELEPQLGEVHATLGFIAHSYDWDWERAEREYQTAIESNPNYPSGHQWYSSLLTLTGRHDEAIRHALQALSLDPLSLILYTTAGDGFFFARRYEASIEHVRRALELDPTFRPAVTDLARAYELSGRHAEAVEGFRRAALLGDERPERSSGMAHALVRAGRREEALPILEAIEKQAAERYVSAYAVGSLHATFGNLDQSFAWLERAFAQRDPALVWLKVHPRLDPLRGDPRYADLLRRMRLDS